MNSKLETLNVFILAKPKTPIDSHCLIYNPSGGTNRPCGEKWDDVGGVPKCRNCFFAESNHKHGLAVSETIHESINRIYYFTQ